MERLTCQRTCESGADPALKKGCGHGHPKICEMLVGIRTRS